MKHQSLGRGLSVLLREEIVPISNTDGIKFVSLEDIEPGTYQPRKTFDRERLRELADSIINNGILQPILVSAGEDGKCRIIAGERRWRASKMAGLSEVPVIFKDLSDNQILEISLIENIQREDLSAIEEAEGYERLISEFGYSKEKLADSIRKSRSHVSNMLRLNSLSDAVKEFVKLGKLSMGHARCLIGNEHAEVIASYIIENDLSVRQTEAIVKNWLKEKTTNSIKNSKSPIKIVAQDDRIDNADDDLQMLAKSLSEKFNIKVTIENYMSGGRLVFHYSDVEQLDSMLSRW